MKKHIAWLAAGLLGIGLAGVTAAPAYAVDEVAAEVCYVDETHTELTYDLQRSDWVAGTPAEGELVVEGNWDTDTVSTGWSGTIADLGSLDIVADPIQYVGLHIHTDLGTIVYEEEPSYAGNLWSTSAFDGVAAGMGYAAFGSVADYAASNGAVAVTGVDVLYTHPDASSTLVESVTIGGEVITFAPATPESYTDWYIVESGQGVELPEGAVDGEPIYEPNLHRYVVTGSVEVTEQVEAECPLPDPIVLPAPTLVDECGTDNDEVVTPEVEGVFYGVYDYTNQGPYNWMLGDDGYGWEAGDAILVIATYDNWSSFEDDPIAAEGDYVLDTAGNPGWWLPAFTDEECPVTPVIPETPVETPATIVPASVTTTGTAALADTGFNPAPFAMIAALGLLAGASILGIGALATRRKAHQ